MIVCWWCVVVSCVLVVSVTLAAVPVCRHVVVTVQPETDVVIQLLPFDTQSLAITAVTVESLPSSGTLYHLSQVYAVHGYTPMKGAAFTSGTDVATIATDRVLFSAPVGFTSAQFTYSATNANGATLTANRGIVYLTTDGVAVSSLFTASEESWQVVYDASATASWSATSIGNLNHFIYVDSIPLVVGSANNARWSFTAPAKFNSNFARAYNGYMEFWMTSFAGDFTQNRYPNPKRFVALTCSTCNGGNGITLVQNNITYLGDTRYFNFTLNELSINGWKKDPKSVFITSWPSPTNCEFFQVLSALTSVAIYPDATTLQESVGIDDVKIHFGHTDASVSCYS